MSLHRPGSIHRCLMAYPDGARIEEPRRSENLRVWILANKTFHPTAALFVDGRCRWRGRLKDDQIAAIEQEPASPSPTSITTGVQS